MEIQPNKKWVITLEEDPETGDLILPFPEDLLKEVGWIEGDTLKWSEQENGAWTLAKKADDE
jgi:hypothetical protein